MGAILAFLATDKGIALVGVVASAIWGAVKGRTAVVAKAERKLTEAEKLAEEVYRVVEGLYRSGKLDPAIALLGGKADPKARHMAKWARAATVFAEGWRARHKGQGPGMWELDAMRAVIERAAGRGE